MKYSANYVFQLLTKQNLYWSIYESCLKMCQDSEHFDGDRLFLIKAMTKNMENKNPVLFPVLFGNTFLHSAAKIGDLEVCQYLLEKLEDKNPRNAYDKNTPLHVASKMGHFSICQLIINNIENLKPVNRKGKTPFDLAEEAGHKDICNLIESAIEIQNKT